MTAADLTNFTFVCSCAQQTGSGQVRFYNSRLSLSLSTCLLLNNIITPQKLPSSVATLELLDLQGLLMLDIISAFMVMMLSDHFGMNLHYSGHGRDTPVLSNDQDFKKRIKQIVYLLSSSGPGPRSGPGQVPGQVQKVQGLRTNDLGLDYTLLCQAQGS